MSRRSSRSRQGASVPRGSKKEQAVHWSCHQFGCKDKLTKSLTSELGDRIDVCDGHAQNMVEMLKIIGESVEVDPD